MATKQFDAYDLIDALTDADEFAVWDTSAGALKNVNRTLFFPAATLEEAENPTETAVRMFSPLRVKQVADARIVAANDWIVAEKTILESRSASGAAGGFGTGVPLDDNELQLPVEAGAQYRIAGELLVIYAFGEAGGFKWNLLVPAVDNLTLFVGITVVDGTNGASVTQHYNTKEEIASTGTAFVDGTGGIVVPNVTAAKCVMTWRGYLDGGAAGGLFKFKWSTWTPGNGAAANLYPGSWIGLKKVS